MQKQLNLDEALISLNNTLTHESVKLLYQLDECQGCPLVNIKDIPKLSTYDIKVTTKYPVHLQLRDNGSNGFICEWLETFNDHGHYALDVRKSPAGGKNCTLSIIDEGSCELCPIVVLVLTLLLISSLEFLFRFSYRWWINRKEKQAGDEDRASKDTSIDTEQPIEKKAPVPTDNVQQQEDIDGVKYVVHSQLEEPAPGGGKSLSAPNVDFSAANQTEVTMDAGQVQSEDANSEPNTIGLIKQIDGSRRVESLDIFRGLTIASMIFVNYGGAGYVFLEHSVWDGVTLADFVFPFFIFILGFSVPISIRSLIKRNVPHQIVTWKIVRRSILLLVIGLCLNSLALKDGDLENLRIPGVLQRFSVSYMVVATTHYISSLIQTKISQSCPRRISQMAILSATFEIAVAMLWLGIYLYYSFFWEYDSKCPIGYTGPGGISYDGRYYNCTGGAAGYIDRYLFSENHLYHDHEVKEMYLTNVSHDPEGLLGCATSILLAMIGSQCGKILLKYKSHKARISHWAHWILFTGLSTVLVVLIPINKRLWSITYVALSAVCAISLYLVLYVLIDVFKIRRTAITRLLSSAGKNPLFLYIGHSMCSRMIPWHFAVDENSHAWLLFRVTWATTIWLIIAHLMASRSIVIKI